MVVVVGMVFVTGLVVFIGCVVAGLVVLGLDVVGLDVVGLVVDGLVGVVIGWSEVEGVKVVDGSSLSVSSVTILLSSGSSDILVDGIIDILVGVVIGWSDVEGLKVVDASSVIGPGSSSVTTLFSTPKSVSGILLCQKVSCSCTMVTLIQRNQKHEMSSQKKHRQI